MKRKKLALHNRSAIYDGWFVSLSWHRLQNCSNGGITTATSGPARCEAVLHGCRTSLVEKGYVFVVVYILATSKVTPGRVFCKIQIFSLNTRGYYGMYHVVQWLLTVLCYRRGDFGLH